MKHIYHCSACRYTFEAEPYTDFPAQCPDCGRIEVRPAGEEEIEEFIRVRAEIAAEAAD